MDRSRSTTSATAFAVLGAALLVGAAVLALLGSFGHRLLNAAQRLLNGMRSRKAIQRILLARTDTLDPKKRGR